MKVDENGAYMDEAALRTEGRFEIGEEAIAAWRAIVERSLQEQLTPGITADAFFAAYKSFGGDPFVIDHGGDGLKFSAWEYAAARAAELCAQP